MSKKEKSFDTNNWVREVRDEMFKKYFKGDFTEFLKVISKPSEQEDIIHTSFTDLNLSKIGANKSINKKEKSFDAVKWVREVRDKMYEENKHLSTAEYFKKISNQCSEEMMIRENQNKYNKKN